jgi:iron(III) transport system substrate-binding protein
MIINFKKRRMTMLKKNKVILLLAAVFVAVLALAGCGTKAGDTGGTTEKEGSKAETKELVIYSGRKEKLIQPVLDAFTEETGIKVTMRAGGASELANAIMEEKNNPQADLFVANDAGTLEKLRLEGLLDTYDSEAMSKVPADLKSEDNSWTGVSARTRVIMYNTNLIKEEELPKSVFDLTDPKWKGQVAVAKGSNESVVGHITAIRKIKDEKTAEDFLKGLLANQVKVLKGHTEVRNAVGKGEFKLGLVNHYYYHLQKQEGSPVGVIYPDQGADQMGTVVNVAGAAIIKGAKNAEAARKFMDFLLKPETQQLFAEVNFEIPVLPGVPVKDAKALDGFKRADIKLDVLGKEIDNTMNLLEKVGMP